MTNIRQAPFALRIVQRKTGKAAIVYRRKADKKGVDRLQRVAAISPLAFTAATPLLREAASRFDFDTPSATQSKDFDKSKTLGTELNPAENQKNLTLTVGPFHPLDADYGARVSCFALIATGLRDGERLTRAANHLRHADPNEAAWWFGLLTRDDNARALRALRILTEAVQ